MDFLKGLRPTSVGVPLICMHKAWGNLMLYDLPKALDPAGLVVTLPQILVGLCWFFF